MAKVNKRKIRYLPRRPKRPLTGFNLFFRYIYFSKCDIPSLRWKKRTEIMKEAAAAWKCCPQRTRRIYNATADCTVAPYRKEIKQWHAMKLLLKKPSNPYQLFFKDFAKEANGCIPFGRLSRCAGKRWKELDAGKKRTYFKRSAKNWCRYCEIQKALKGGACLEDFV